MPAGPPPAPRREDDEESVGPPAVHKAPPAKAMPQVKLPPVPSRDPFVPVVYKAPPQDVLQERHWEREQRLGSDDDASSEPLSRAAPASPGLEFEPSPVRSR